MDRRKFLNLTATTTGGLLLVPEFLLASEKKLLINDENNDNIVVVIQLNGGNDGLNTIVPYSDAVYYDKRKVIAIPASDVLKINGSLGFNPSLTGFNKILQNGDLTILQNVGYPNPNLSHFRSREIWTTASNSNEFLKHGWIGRFLHEFFDHDGLGYLNIDDIENIAIKSPGVNGLTIRDLRYFDKLGNSQTTEVLSGNPLLDYARKIAINSIHGSSQIGEALQKSKGISTKYEGGQFGNNLNWIFKLISGKLPSKFYYTSLGGFDTHANQKQGQTLRLATLDGAVFDFYSDLKKANLLDRVTIVIFSEFGRRVKENGTGTDHGTAGPMFIIGGKNKGRILGKNPDLVNLDNGNLIHDIDFRSVYAAILQNKYQVNPQTIGIKQDPLINLF